MDLFFFRFFRPVPKLQRATGPVAALIHIFWAWPRRADCYIWRMNRSGTGAGLNPVGRLAPLWIVTIVLRRAGHPRMSGWETAPWLFVAGNRERAGRPKSKAGVDRPVPRLNLRKVNRPGAGAGSKPDGASAWRSTRLPSATPS